MTRAHVIIKGRVQGVCYRAFTQEVAKKLGLTGWVRNKMDGTVEAVFDGERSKIEEAINLCWEGPSLAHVSDIEIQWQEIEKGHTDFRITH